MKRQITDQELHELWCPLKNTKSALFLVAFFSWEAFTGWKGLHKPPEHPDLFRLLFLILVTAMLAKWLMNFTCFRERLVLSLVIVNLAAGEVSGFFPAIVEPYIHLVKSAKLSLWVLCLLVTLTMLVRSARTPKVELNQHQASNARQLAQNSLIVLAVAAAILILGSLLYFLP